MDDGRPFFILAGNGPYENRGCEAIVRGTTVILREHFTDPRILCFNHIESDEQFRRQCREETDPAITHLRSHRMSRRQALRRFWRPESWLYMYRSHLNPAALKYDVYRDMLPHLNGAAAVLSIGGDNYSLDYWVPTLFTDLDDIVLERKRPLAIWGASIGPFGAMPDYERYMSRHLREVPGIFARESATIDYLESIGVTENVYPVADPAFLMDPVRPEGIEDVLPLDEEAIGLNLSPLMAKYATGGDLDAWALQAGKIIETVAKTTGMPVCLIPHVTYPTSDDHGFMERALSRIQNRNGDITLVPPKYNAAETKWIIGRMALFAGARTHATIAALSSGVPTLSFAYSIKARGINRDIFGHTDHCLEPGALGPGAVAGRVAAMLDGRTAIRGELTARIPAVRRAALSAGAGLRAIIGVD
ncbi:polysaccharide pyruvyl transferase family protein [Methanoculleus sp.]|uniref:polysaccharide pyruvyl transferase family protein n=1 Tax=Methanoculleus sp. TaxID=90427 RepID=UPI0025EA296B|nr:polysaccharide pyruvyl transferase family protein [Methanoculleus sp.]